MMMDRRHLKYPFSTGNFKISDLKHSQKVPRSHKAVPRSAANSSSFITIAAAASPPSKRQRTRIAHEHLCGVPVEHQESQTSTAHLPLQKYAPAAMSVRSRRPSAEEQRYERRHTGGQAVQSVRQVHRIRHGQHDKYDKRDIPDAESRHKYQRTGMQTSPSVCFPSEQLARIHSQYHR